MTWGELGQDHRGRCRACLRANWKKYKQVNKDIPRFKAEKIATVQQDMEQVVKDRQMTESECVRHLYDFTRQLMDGFDPPSKVIRYMQGTEDFDRVARLYEGG